MRSRRPINTWPAFADLMTVLAVPGLFVALALLPLTQDKEDLLAKIRQLEQENLKLKYSIASIAEKVRIKEATLAQVEREAARNKKMFRAIQTAQQFVDTISTDQGLEFGPDQSLQFGDDLVSFEINSVVPKWKVNSRDRLWKFCEAVSRGLAKTTGADVDVQELFDIHVEGHTDSTGCRNDPHCNWWISSGRAANFVAVMRQETFCPGGKQWNLLPIGYADTKFAAGLSEPTRRIALRVVPNYERIITKYR